MAKEKRTQVSWTCTDCLTTVFAWTNGELGAKVAQHLENCKGSK